MRVRHATGICESVLISTRVKPLCAVLPMLFSVVMLSRGLKAQSAAAAVHFPDEGISREFAADRAKVLSNIRYRYEIVVEKLAPRMRGHALIQFDAANTKDALFLDFRDIDSKGGLADGAARNLRINGHPESVIGKNGHLLIPAKHLRRDANRVELDFDSGIAEANHAITRFVDHEDGAEYIYSLFVPMDANLAFPCFDQPDLKAKFTLEVTAPQDWVVVSNGIDEPGREGARDGHMWRFGETKPISTYLFAFAAGPFETITSHEQAGDLNLRLFVRRSQIARAREEWPEISERTRQGLRYLSDFFAQSFPFPKYDQVLIPGFAYGGMEHAGATFLNEDSMLFRSAPTQNDHNRRSETVLHELSHQWFGDLVTMRWFDDLWLKEGFAQYMAYRTMATIQSPDEVWKRFYNSIKRAAYAIDSTHGTTPIYQQIANLKDAKSAYGAIVYSKAPSLLRFLAYRIGDDPFRDGVRAFLREHAFANATWSDLISAFSRSANQDLSNWASAWIEQRGMPQIEMNWECAPSRQGGREDLRITKFTITQRDALGEGHLWPISSSVFFGYRTPMPERSGTDTRRALLNARIETGATELSEAQGRDCPDYIFGNDQDFAYGEFLLDERSQKAVSEIAPGTENPFRRALLWGALWDAVRESKMAPVDFINLAIRSLPQEEDPELALSLLGRVRTAYVRFLSDEQRNNVTSNLESLLIDEMQHAPVVDLRITYFRGLVDVAKNETARRILQDLLTAKSAVPGVSLKQRDRWSIVARLIATAAPAAEDLFAAERAKDQSEEGRKYAYVAEAGRARAETKQKYFNDYTSATASPAVSEDWITASLGSFNLSSQSGLTLQYLRPALDALPQMKRTRKIFFVLNWLDSFVGGQNSAEALQVLNRFLESTPLDPDLKLKVLEVKDELDRAVRIQAKYGQTRNEK